MTNEAPWSSQLDWPSDLKPFDPFDTEIQADPYAHYRWMRENAPVLRAGLPEAPLHIVSLYRDVNAGLRDAETFSSEMGQAEPLPGFILNMDPPEHTRLRALVSAAFTPRAMQELEPKVLAIVTEMWGAILARSGGDLMGEFASRCTIAVISAVLGIPVSQSSQMREWTSQTIAYMGRLLRGVPDIGADATGREALLAHIDAIFDRMVNDDNDTVAANLARLRRDGLITREEASGFAALLFMAGHETTTILTGNCLDVLMQHPEYVEMLRTSAGAKAFLDEMIRFRPPVHRVTRRTTRDTEIAGRQIPAGASIRFLIGSANRDEAIFTDGDIFAPSRRPTGNASFGYGPHMCIGSWLARLEVRLILETIGNTTERIAADASLPRLPLLGGAFATVGLHQLGGRLEPKIPRPGVEIGGRRARAGQAYRP